MNPDRARAVARQCVNEARSVPHGVARVLLDELAAAEAALTATAGPMAAARVAESARRAPVGWEP